MATILKLRALNGMMDVYLDAPARQAPGPVTHGARQLHEFAREGRNVRIRVSVWPPNNRLAHISNNFPKLLEFRGTPVNHEHS